MTVDSTRRRRAVLGLIPRDLALIALFAALIAVLGLVPGIPVAGVPVAIVLQNLGIFLAGSLLGPRRGVLAVLAFLALVAAGLPLLSGGYGGISVFPTASLGYFIGWVLSAVVIGWLAKLGARAKGRGVFWWFLIANVIGGVLLIDFVGATISVAFTGIGLGATYIGSLIFLPGDLIKAVIAALIAAGVQRAYPVPPTGVRRGEEAPVLVDQSR
jgi:biotin transport system substrate-specific component